MRYKVLISGILAIIMLLTMLPSCGSPDPADGYTIVIPETFLIPESQVEIEDGFQEVIE